MFEWIITSSVLIIVFILLRKLLKGRISLRLQYGLWAIVLVRLLIPFTIGQSPFSVLTAVENAPSYETISVTLEQSASPFEGIPISDLTLEDALDAVQNALPAEPQNTTSSSAATPSAPVSTDALEETGRKVLFTVWVIGMAGMALWFLTVNLTFSLRVKKCRQFFEVESSPLPIYVSDQVDTPCLFGLFRPAIYLTPTSARNPEQLAHVRAHEETHYRHKDHIWALLRCICLVIHWYNPLVWLAAVLSRRDCELACDEGTLLRLGEDQRHHYGRTLIELTCQRRDGLLKTATTMTGSKKTLWERVQLIAKKPRMTALTLAAAVLVCAVAVVCTFTGGVNKEEQEQIETIKEFLTAYYTVPDSRWVDAERELWNIIQETGETPKDDADFPQYKAVQAMFGEYVPEESLTTWYLSALYLHSESYDDTKDFATVYTITPGDINVKLRDEASGERWDAEVPLTFQPTDGEPTKLTLHVLLTLTEDGLIHSMDVYGGNIQLLNSLIYDSTDVGPFSGFNIWEICEVLLSYPIEDFEETYLAVQAGEADNAELVQALKTALGENQCTDQIYTDYLNGIGFGALRQACIEYGLTAELQDIQVSVYEHPLKNEFYLKTLVTNQYGKQKLVNITGIETSTEDGALESITITGGLDAFLNTVAEFAEEGKPVEREWTEENRMRWSSEGAFDSISSEEAAGLSYEELAQLWAEKEAERLMNISSEDNPLYCTDAEVMWSRVDATSLTSPKRIVFSYYLACNAADNAILGMLGNAGGIIEASEYPEYEGWYSICIGVVLKLESNRSWSYHSGGSGGLGGWGYLDFEYEQDQTTLNTLLFNLVTNGSLDDPENLIRRLPFADWSKFDADYGEAGWDELTDLLMIYGLNGGRWYSEVQSWLEVYPEDQLYRNLYVMHAAIAAGDEYGERFAPILQNQKNYSADDFARSLQELDPEEQTFISNLIA